MFPPLRRFQQALVKPINIDPEARMAFENMDCDDSGTISRSELSKCLRTAGLSVDGKDVKNILDEFDANMDGQLSLAEFQKLFKALPKNYQEALLTNPADLPQDGGTLRVRLDRATGLKPASPEGETSSPYVKLRLSGQELRGKTVTKSLSPKWSETLEFNLRSPPKGENLEVRVYHDRAASENAGGVKDDYLGGSKVLLGELSQITRRERKCEAKLDKQGYVHLAVTWLPRGEDDKDGGSDTDEIGEPGSDDEGRAPRVNMKDPKAIFDRFDKDGKGVMRRADLLAALRLLGVKLESMQAVDILREFDRSGNGKLSLAQFTRLGKRLLHEEQVEDSQFDDSSALFDRVDTKGLGLINARQLREALVAAGLESAARNAAALLREFDGDHDGQIDQPEFTQLLLQQKRSQKSEMRRAKVVFGRFDSNNSGFLGVRDLKSALRMMGESSTVQQQATALLRQFDMSNSGKLSLRDFCSLFEHLQEKKLVGASMQGDFRSSKRVIDFLDDELDDNTPLFDSALADHVADPLGESGHRPLAFSGRAQSASLSAGALRPQRLRIGAVGPPPDKMRSPTRGAKADEGPSSKMPAVSSGGWTGSVINAAASVSGMPASARAATTAPARPAGAGGKAGPALRFAEGDRVECYVQNGWLKGTVVKLWSREGKATAKAFPYKVLLDQGGFVHAAADVDSVVRRLRSLVSDSLAAAVAESAESAAHLGGYGVAAADEEVSNDPLRRKVQVQTLSLKKDEKKEKKADKVDKDASLQALAAVLRDLAKASSKASDKTSIGDAMRDAGAVEALVGLLQPGHEPQVKAEAAAALCPLAHDAKCREQIGAVGGAAALVKALDPKAPTVAAPAASTLAELASSDDHHEKIIAADGVNKLVGLLDEGASDEVLQTAAAALAELACTESTAQLICEADGVDLLTKLLQPETKRAASARAACTALTNLAAVPKHRQAICDAGAVVRLVAMIKLPEAISVEGVSALCNLACSAASAAVIREAGGVAPLVVLCEREGKEHAKVVERAACTLCNLACSGSSCKDEIRVVGGLTPLVRLLGEKGSAATMAAAALAELAAHPANQDAIADVGGIPAIASLLRQGPSQAAEHAAAAVYQLARSEPNRDLLREAGVIRPLVKLLREPGSEEAHAAAGALCVLSANSLNELAIREAGGIAPLVALVRNGEPRSEAVESAVGALYNLACNDEENREVIRDAGGIDALVTLLRDPQGTAALGEGSEVVDRAAAALFNMACSAANDEAIRRAGGISALVGLLHLGARSVAAESSAGALRNLACDRASQDAIRNQGGLNLLLALVSKRMQKGVDPGTTGSHAEAALLNLMHDNIDNEDALLELVLLEREAPPSGPLLNALQTAAARQLAEAQEFSHDPIVLGKALDVARVLAAADAERPTAVSSGEHASKGRRTARDTSPTRRGTRDISPTRRAKEATGAARLRGKDGNRTGKAPVGATSRALASKTGGKSGAAGSSEDSKDPTSCLEDAKRIFEALGVSHWGHIKARELKTVLTALGVAVNNERAERILSEFDENGDAKLSVHELSRLLKDMRKLQADNKRK